MAETRSLTILELLNSCTAYLEKRGIESARLNSEHLLAHILGKRRLELYLEFDRPLFEPVLAPMRELLRKRGEGIPLQHLLGTVEFLGHTFKCDARALIPRPETEQMVELILKKCVPPPRRVLELGVGSGVIIASLATSWKEAELVGVDQSTDALALSAENLATLGLHDRVTLKASDGFSAVEGTFDLIVSNPPYVPRETIPTLSREVRHDPILALDGGPEGTELPTDWIARAPAFLNPGGWMIIEHGDGQSPLLHQSFLSHHFHTIEAVADYQGALRFLFARHG